MKVTGIIAECNPLHEGHKYLLEEARRQTGADYIVVALSGDYVQRGAPAIVSREARTAELLKAGADLVAELPLYVSCAGADYFARGSVALLESLGVVTDLVFGSETADIDALRSAAVRLNEESGAFQDSLREGLRSGLSFPGARAAAMEDLDLPSTPNDLLGTEYLRALERTGSRIKPHALGRIDCPSASQIRSEMILARQNSDSFLCRDDFSDLLLHALYRAESAEDLTCYLDVSKDLAGRILRELPSYTSFTQFCEAVKTRSYTYTRVSRALLHILLGMKTQTMDYLDHEHALCGWIRLAGFKKSAAPLLHSIAESSTVPVLDKLARAQEVLPKELYAVLSEQLRAEFLYDLMARQRIGTCAAPAVSAFRKPILITE